MKTQRIFATFILILSCVPAIFAQESTLRQGVVVHEEERVVDKNHEQKDLPIVKLIPLRSVQQVDASHDSGRLCITTYPYNAEISVNNLSFDTSPRILELPVGEYDVMLSKQGYDTLYRHVSIAADSLTLIDEQLSAQEGVSASVETTVVDVEYEETKAELEKQIEWKNSLYTPIQPRFEQIALIGFPLFLGMDVQPLFFELNYIAGYRFSKVLYLGAGVGFLYGNARDVYYLHSSDSKYFRGSSYKFPLFGHIRVYFTGGKPMQFYMGATAGYIFEPDAELEIYRKDITKYVPFNASSFYFSPGLGINIRTGKRANFDFSISYHGRNAVWYSTDEQFHNRWFINLGITF